MEIDIQNKEAQYVRIYKSSSGGSIDLHPLHGKDELSDNLEACKILADHGHKIELLPIIPSCEIELRKKYLPEVLSNKNPDVRINGQLIGDIKRPGEGALIKKAIISRQILSAAKQKVDIAIINLYKRKYTVQDVKKGVVGALQPDRNKSISLVWIITSNRNIFTISRQIVFDDSIYEALTDL